MSDTDPYPYPFEPNYADVVENPARRPLNRSRAFWPYVLSMETPIVHPCFGVTCLFLNFFISGLGTFVVSFSSAAKYQRRNLLICAALQFFFFWLFLPWWWSVMWAIVLVLNTRYYRRTPRRHRDTTPTDAHHGQRAEVNETQYQFVGVPMLL